MLKPKKVQEIIKRFEFTPNQSMAILMEDARVLACQSYHYAELLGDLGIAYRQLHVKRKTRFAKLVNAFREQGNSVTASEKLASEDPEYIELYENEYEAEGRYQKGKLMFESISKVIDRMNQEIAELRKEEKYQRHMQQV